MRCRWLGDEQDHFREWVRYQCSDGEGRHAATDVLVEVASPEPDHLGNPNSPPIEKRHCLLSPGAGGRDHAYRPGRDDVRESQPGAGKHGGPSSRPHEEALTGCSVLLERDLIGPRHVVAEEQDVEAAPERLVRLKGGVVTRHRDDGDVCGGL